MALATTGHADRRGKGPDGTPDPDARRATDLAVHGADEQVHVVLVQMPPVYRYGLAALLRAVGIRCSSTSSTDQLGEVLAATGTRVLVLDAVVAASLPRPLGNTANGLFAVHVVPELTSATYAHALRSGATGVVAVDAELHHAVDVIRAAAAGNSLLGADVARSLCRPATSSAPQVSVRERAWLRRLGDGATVAGLARADGYSEREMYRRLAGLYSRLGAANRTGALVLAERWGLLAREE
jgi:DNA-binding NarL/FixJ family response regulator